MLKRISSGWIILFVMFGLMVGMVSGVTGGVAGYLVATNGAQLSARSGITSASNSGTAVTDINVTENSAVIDTVKQAEPAVVTIQVTLQQTRGRFGSRTAIAEGSGVIIDAQGHIVTNAHVVQGAQQVDVILSDGSTTTAQVIGADTNKDVAVLQLSGKVPGFLALGNSDSIQLGETVVAIGSPLGDYRGSVTVGVISGLDRSVSGSGESGLLQTDAAINNGNSGGPLLNLAGQVIGINTLVVRASDSGNIAEGLGFAIPSNTVTSVANQIISSVR